MNSFFHDGYLVQASESKSSHSEIKEIVISSINEQLERLIPGHKKTSDLSRLHESLPIDNVNEVRVNAYNSINNSLNLHDKCFNLVEDSILKLLGPDLAVQAKINLSIVMPNDASSVIPLHSDINTGEPLHELVIWIPITNCHDTNSIFLTDKSLSFQMHSLLPDLNNLESPTLSETADELFDFNYLKVDSNSVIVFSPLLYHGSNTNTTNTTRISLNYRMKSIFTPFEHSKCEGKGLNSFFVPFRESYLTKLVKSYRLPQFS